MSDFLTSRYNALVTTDPLLDQIRDTWDSAAEHYDTDPGHGLMSDGERQHWLRIIRRLIPVPSQRVLDVGTGTGVMAFLLAECGHTVTGLDIAPSMLEIARAHNTERDASVRFELGPADAPPFAPASFDVVFSRHVLWTLLDPVAAAKAWREQLAPGGRAVVIDGIWPHGPADKLSMSAGKLLARITRQPPDDDHRYPDDLYAKLPMIKARSLAEPTRVFEQTGFRDVHAEYIPRGESHTPRNLSERLMHRWRGYALVGRVA